MLDETIASAQHNNSESLLALIEKFKPLLKKYAYKLHYEDAYYDLQLDFIQIPYVFLLFFKFSKKSRSFRGRGNPNRFTFSKILIISFAQ